VFDHTHIKKYFFNSKKEIDKKNIGSNSIDLAYNQAETNALHVKPFIELTAFTTSVDFLLKRLLIPAFRISQITVCETNTTPFSPIPS